MLHLEVTGEQDIGQPHVYCIAVERMGIKWNKLNGCVKEFVLFVLFNQNHVQPAP